ncbi:MAG: DUF615 domain-containing protein [Deltaproteobacteria bacterium]|nr:DUF615 domain-containing protein [Deltaproteobacteria bacterium]
MEERMFIDGRPNKSALKRAALAVEKLASRLVELSPAQLDRLRLPEDIGQGVRLAARIVNGNARSRQIKYLAAQLRNDEDLTGRLKAFFDGEEQRDGESIRRFHGLEDLRDRLCASGTCAQALEELHDVFSKSDLETIARLARSAQEGDRRAAREIFRRLNQSALGAAAQDHRP